MTERMMGEIIFESSTPSLCQYLIRLFLRASKGRARMMRATGKKKILFLRQPSKIKGSET
jgi:hypothetical protein